MLAGLTLLPTLLTIFGRRGFWPSEAQVDYDPEHAEVIHTGLWRRFGDRVLHRPGPALAVTAGVFLLGALGPDRLQGRLLEHHLLQEVGGERRGLQGAE